MKRFSQANRAILLGFVLLATAAGACSKHRDQTPPSAESSPAVAAGSAGSAPNPGASNAADCSACALASRNRNCSPAYLTAQRDKSGEPVRNSFGCGTLATPAARQACSALLTCINKNHCAVNPATKTSPGDNAVQGCYCGAKTDPRDCLAGTGIVGPCAAPYHAAATATDGGPGADAKESVFASFIGPRAFDASTAFGLADNLVNCAMDAPCPACNGL